MKMEQITKEQAIAIYDSKEWEKWTYEEKVKFQLFQDRLAMPFDKFHEAMENVLGRSIWTHEFAGRDSLIKEYLREKPAPDFNQIMSLIPKDKLVFLTV